MGKEVALYVGAALGRYGFPDGHPFGPDRQDAFWKETITQGLDKEALLVEPQPAARAEIERFHSAEYVSRVAQLSLLGHGLIDHGDTPAFPGVYDASSAVVGAALEGLERVQRTVKQVLTFTPRTVNPQPVHLPDVARRAVEF